MPARSTTRAFALLSPVLLLCLLVEAAWAAPLSAVLVSAFPVALIAIGVRRGGHVGGLGAALLALFALLAGSFLALFALRGRVMELPWIGGLPLAAIVQLAGLWLAPLVLVALAHALLFERLGLRREELERLRRIAPPGSARAASPDEPVSPPEDST